MISGLNRGAAQRGLCSSAWVASTAGKLRGVCLHVEALLHPHVLPGCVMAAVDHSSRESFLLNLNGPSLSLVPPVAMNWDPSFPLSGRHLHLQH